MSNTKTYTTIVTGSSAAAREEAIAAALLAPPPVDGLDRQIAVLLEGVPDGTDRFAPLQHASGFRLFPVVRIAPGCLCCTGNLTMRVHLNRLLRARPRQLYIGVSPGTHLTTLQDFLSQPPYDDLLVLGSVLAAH